MPAESLKSEVSDPIPTAAPWPTLMKSPPNEEDETMKAKKKVMETNIPVFESKKSCICSPTSHAGSFRCHLHRAIGASSCCSGSVANTTLKKFNSKQQGGRQAPILSRFGRASSLKLKPISESSLPG